MREIKFRALDKIEKVMLYSDFNSYGFYSKENPELMQENTELVFHFHAWSGDEDFVLMQYTGLKDTNGVEVYEGDILIKRNYGVQKSEKYVVEWIQRDAGFSLTHRYMDEHKGEFWEAFTNVPMHVDEYKVIGNIYENPELLEVRP